MIQPVRKFKDEKRNKIAFTEGVQDVFFNKWEEFTLLGHIQCLIKVLMMSHFW